MQPNILKIIICYLHNITFFKEYLLITFYRKMGYIDFIKTINKERYFIRLLISLKD